MMYPMDINTDLLPTSFTNVIIKNDCTECIIRSNIENMKDVDTWVKEFGFTTLTKWNMRDSKPKGVNMVCMKRFVCHRSAFMKVPKEYNRKGRSKNSCCTSTMKVKIKINTPDTRKRDAYVKKGLCGIICIKKIHSHSLTSTENIAFLPSASEKSSPKRRDRSKSTTVEKKLQTIIPKPVEFDSGIQKTPEKHFLDISDNIINNNVINNNVISDNINENSAERKEINTASKMLCDTDSDDNNGYDCNMFTSNDNNFRSIENINSLTQKKFHKVVNLLLICNEAFGSSLNSVQDIETKLSNIRSKDEWDNFLTMIGNSNMSFTQINNNIPDIQKQN